MAWELINMSWELVKKYLPFKNENNMAKNDYFSASKWWINSYFALGLLPIERNREGKITCNWLGSKMIYSLISYCFFSTIVTEYVVKRRLNESMKSLNFDDRIYNLMFLLFGKNIYFYPIAAWLSINNICAYYNQWNSFEGKYLKTFKNSLNLNQSTAMHKNSVIFSFLASAFLLFGQLLTLPTYNMTECVCYAHSVLVFFLYISHIIVSCKSIEIISEDLYKKLEWSLSRDIVTQDTISAHKKMWISLSDLTKQIGESFWMIMVVAMVDAFIDIVVAGYGYVTLASKHFKKNNYNTLLNVQQFGLIVAVMVSLLPIIFTTHSAHSVRQKVGESFLHLLLMASTKPHHPKVVKDIFEFAEVVNSNPPIISLGGYINVDKRLFTKIFCTLITYLVILIQFRVGLDQMHST